jgi:hypothetical protein
MEGAGSGFYSDRSFQSVYNGKGKGLSVSSPSPIISSSILANMHSQAGNPQEPGDVIIVEHGFALLPESPAFFGHPLPTPEKIEPENFKQLCWYIAARMQHYFNKCRQRESHRVTTLIDQLRRERNTNLINPVREAIMSTEGKSHRDRTSAMHYSFRFFSDARDFEQPERGTICGFSMKAGFPNHSCQPNTELVRLYRNERPGDVEDLGYYQMKTPPIHIAVIATKPIE